MTKKIKAIVCFIICLCLTALSCVPAFAWQTAQELQLDLSLKLVAMANVTALKDSPKVTNFTSVSTGELTGKTLTAAKYPTWLEQHGDGPYTLAQLNSYFGPSAVNTLTTSTDESMVYMLYDLGDPESADVKSNMEYLGITDIYQPYQHKYQ